MEPNIWHGTIGFAIIAGLFGIVAFVAYLLYGPGFTVEVPDFFGVGTTTANVVVDEVPAAASVEPQPVVQDLAMRKGTLFTCDGDRALKADFSEKSVDIALSDGRLLTLPQIVSEEGAIRYENADGSFSFRNVEYRVFVEENGVITYANCTASE